jgi:adenosylcobinamide kinase / adenosylcobinamide-phosphate guanylyltransferase
MKTLFIGGARSGKSTLAARLAGARSKDVCCIVTGTAVDAEMEARIEAHRRARPKGWHVREEPVHLAAALGAQSERHELILIDCLTLWTANCLWPEAAAWPRERAAFIEALQQCAAELILVTNEVGSGIVPEAPSARIFRDEHGRLAQEVAAICDEVMLVTAGIALPLKSAPRSSTRAARAAPSRKLRRRRPGSRR